MPLTKLPAQHLPDRARELLQSGAALRQMQKIIDAQGPTLCRNELGDFTANVRAWSDGVISAIDCLQLNRLARAAGAPLDKGAGIKLFKKIGDRVDQVLLAHLGQSFGSVHFPGTLGSGRTGSGPLPSLHRGSVLLTTAIAH